MLDIFTMIRIHVSEERNPLHSLDRAIWPHHSLDVVLKDIHLSEIWRKVPGPSVNVLNKELLILGLHLCVKVHLDLTKLHDNHVKVLRGEAQELWQFIHKLLIDRCVCACRLQHVFVNLEATNEC